MNVIITPDQVKLLNTEVNGCQHPRNLLVLVDKIILYCTGCGSDMGNVAGV